MNEYVEEGTVLKLDSYSVMVFDIKRFNIKTGVMEDFGFAM